MGILLTLEKISASVVIFGGTAWIIVERGLSDGLIYLFASFVIYLLLITIQYSWIEHKHNRGII